MKTTSAGKDLAVSGRKKPVGEKRVLPARALGAGSFQRNRLGYACVPSQVGFFGQIATNGKKGIRLGMLISVSLAGGDGGGAVPGSCGVAAAAEKYVPLAKSYARAMSVQESSQRSASWRRVSRG